MNKCIMCGRAVADSEVSEKVHSDWVICKNARGHSQIQFRYTTRGKRCLGRWYAYPDRISIFLNRLAEIHNPDTDFEGFIAELSAVEFHELGHIFGFRNGCRKCNGKNCYWCRFADVLHIYFETGIWNKGMSEYLKTGKVLQ